MAFLLARQQRYFIQSRKVRWQTARAPHFFRRCRGRWRWAENLLLGSRLVEALVIHVLQRQFQNAAGPHLVEHAINRGSRAAESPRQRIDRLAAARLLI